MSDFLSSFQQDFIEKDRYLYLLRGLGNTLLIAVLAVLLGIVVGFLVAIIRSTHDKHGGLNVLNFICKMYLTIWRGTPTMVQLLIMYYIILVALDNKIAVAVKDYILVSHQGKEPAIKALLAELDKKAVIHAELALGEGTGAVMLFPLLDMAMQVYRENTTFDDIQITAYEDYGKC